jgi:hypothetical protein
MQEKAPKSTKMAEILAADWQQKYHLILRENGESVREEPHFERRNLQ